MGRLETMRRRRRVRRVKTVSLAAAVAVVLGVAGWGADAQLIHSDPPASGASTATGALTSGHSPKSAIHPASVVSDVRAGQAGWVIAENQRPGSTSWQISGTPPGAIAGFAGVTSARAGQSVTLYVNTHASTFKVEAYRMGYYGGDGARLVWSSADTPGRTQPACPLTSGVNMVACDDWAPSLTFTVSPAFVQGDYLLKLVGSGGQQSYVPLTIWDPTSHGTYLVENDIYTWQAWNAYGGYDFYAGIGHCAAGIYPVCNRARVVSFDRPYAYGDGAADFLGNELPFVSYAERLGLDVTYATSADLQEDPAFLLQHRVLLSLGHDECWSLLERQAAQAAEKHGVNMVFFGASPILRHVRMQASPLGPDREEVDYRDGAADPLDGTGHQLEVTGNTWSAPPANWSEVPFVGAEYTGYVEPGAAAVPMRVVDSGSWLYAGTGLADGSELPGLLVSDFDQYEPGLSPRNVQILAHSPMPRSEVQTSTAHPASDITYYNDPASEAGVFDTGTVAWIPDLAGSAPLRQMTANLLRLFGRGPAGLVQPSLPNSSSFY